MEIILEDEHFIVSFFANFVNAAEKIYDENHNLIQYKKIGELMLKDSGDFDTEEDMIRMAEFCIKFCTRSRIIHKFVNPSIKKI